MRLRVCEDGHMANGTPNGKLFISWAKDPAKQYALALSDWLRDVFDSLETWTSQADLMPGERSLAEIDKRLQEAVAGVVVVTPENQNEPWLSFEAGYLACHVGNGARRVIPLTMDGLKPGDLTGPLGMLQGVQFGRDGVKQLLESLCEVVGLDKGRADRKMDAFWDRLESRIADLANSRTVPARVQKRSSDDKIDEILTTVRDMRDDMDRQRMREDRDRRAREAVAASLDSQGVSDAMDVLRSRRVASGGRATSSRVTDVSRDLLDRHEVPVSDLWYDPVQGTLHVRTSEVVPLETMNAVGKALRGISQVLEVEWGGNSKKIP